MSGKNSTSEIKELISEIRKKIEIEILKSADEKIQIFVTEIKWQLEIIDNQLKRKNDNYHSEEVDNHLLIINNYFYKGEEDL